MTVSSFTTLSLSSKPMVSFNVQLPSRGAKTFTSSKLFAVNFLASTEKHAAIAHAFASSDLNDTQDSLFCKKCDFEEISSFGNVPVLCDALVVFYCKVVREIYSGTDHILYLGEVVSVKNNTCDENVHGLLYCNRQFHRVGNDIKYNV